MTTTPTPAFRVTRGDTVTIDRIKWTVSHVQPMTFIPRSRNAEVAPSDRSGVRFTLRHPRRRSREATFRNYDRVAVVR
jgi:hypothetical protein